MPKTWHALLFTLACTAAATWTIRRVSALNNNIWTVTPWF